MLTQFICPDNNTIKIEDCIKSGGCRLGKRCLTKATLIELAKIRPWNGIPSTTQLLVGTYEMMLRITKDYAESPQDMMYRLLGTRVHGGLESEDVEDSIMEDDLQMVTSHGISMRPDLLETEDNWNIITDYKVSGSFKIMKALGMYAYLEESNTEVYKQQTKIKDPLTGIDIYRKAGDKKLIKKWTQDINKQDCIDWVRQINFYRIGLQEQGYKIDEMRIEAIVRDGGLMSALNYGIDKKVYLIPLPFLSDDQVIGYFTKKKNDLLKAVETNDWSFKCSGDECWDGNKCKLRDDGRSYCSVREYCKFMV